MTMETQIAFIYETLSGEPITASTNSWDVACDILWNKHIIAVDHDKDVIVVEYLD